MAEDYDQSQLKSFEKHEVQVIEPYDYETLRGEYIWGQPNSMFYHMHIIFRAGIIIIYGDLGAWVLSPGGRSLPWLRGAINNPTYMFEKCKDHKGAYDQEATKENAYNFIYDYKEQGCYIEHGVNVVDWEEEIRKAMEWVDWSDPNSTYDFFNDTLELDEAYEYVAYTWKAEGWTWPWLGLKTFLEALDKHHTQAQEKELGTTGEGA